MLCGSDEMFKILCIFFFLQCYLYACSKAHELQILFFFSGSVTGFCVVCVGCTSFS